jgi:hypothetical protein
VILAPLTTFSAPQLSHVFAEKLYNYELVEQLRRVLERGINTGTQTHNGLHQIASGALWCDLSLVTSHLNVLFQQVPSTTVVDRGFRREPGASAPGKSANFECLQARAFAPFLRQEASTTVVLA